MDRSGAGSNGVVKHRPPAGQRQGIWVTHADRTASFLGWVTHTEHQPGANVPLRIYFQNGSILSLVKWPLVAQASSPPVYLPELPLPAPRDDEAPASPPSATEYAFHHRSRP